MVDRQAAQLARQQGTFVKMSFASQDLPTKHFRDSYSTIASLFHCTRFVQSSTRFKHRVIWDRYGCNSISVEFETRSEPATR